MVLLVRRRTLFILVLATVALVLATSVLAYVSIDAAGELSPAERKILAERILFAGIVGSAIVLIGLVAVIYDTVSLNTLLKRLSQMYGLSGDQLRLALRRFGSVGDELWSLYENINALSERKSRRIVAMNSLLTEIVERSDQKMLIVNAAGEVYKVTEAALEHLELSSSKVVEQPVESIITGATFLETTAALARNADSFSIEGEHETVAVVPVSGDQGLAAYYLYLLGADAKKELKREPSAGLSDGHEGTSAGSRAGR